MPFTLAHPAAIIPIKRVMRGANFSALVIGSMAPDFAYFLSLGMPRGFSHSLMGMLYFCIPAGLLGYFIFHLILKRPVVLLLPDFIRTRLEIHSSAWMPRTIRAFAMLIVSVALGALTHVLWDSFTHANTYVVQNVGWLSWTYGPYFGRHIPMYKILQHLSTLSGLLILVFSLRRWIDQTPGMQLQNNMPSNLRAGILVAFIAIGLAGFFTGIMNDGVTSLEAKLFYGCVNAIQWLFMATSLYCLMVHASFHFGRKNI